MLGATGIEAAERDCARLRDAGKRPAIVLLISGVTVAITTSVRSTDTTVPALTRKPKSKKFLDLQGIARNIA